MKKNSIGKILMVIGVIACIAAAAYALYRYFRPELVEEFTDDLDRAFVIDDDDDDSDEFEDTTLDD